VATTLAAAVGCRNILVHRYLDVHDERVIGSLGSVDALDAFVASALRLIEG